MKIKKTNESITRIYTDGKPEDTVTNVTYEIQDDEGHRLGELYVNNGGSYRVSMSGDKTSTGGTKPSIEAAVAEVKRLFNITE